MRAATHTWAHGGLARKLALATVVSLLAYACVLAGQLFGPRLMLLAPASEAVNDPERADVASRGRMSMEATAPVWKWFAADWPHDPGGTAWFDGAQYRLMAREPGRFVAVGAPINAPLRDVSVSARFQKGGGPAGGGYGIIVRDAGPGRRDGQSQEGHYYVLEAGDRGEFGIWRRNQDHWIELIPWTPTNAVRSGTASNELTVVATGQRLIFFINGTQVANVADTTLPEGGVGVFVGGDANDVVVERFTVERLETLSPS
jgi:hypothetical protein